MKGILFGFLSIMSVYALVFTSSVALAYHGVTNNASLSSGFDPRWEGISITREDGAHANQVSVIKASAILYQNDLVQDSSSAYDYYTTSVATTVTDTSSPCNAHMELYTSGEAGYTDSASTSESDYDDQYSICV